MNNLLGRIEINEQIMVGKPVIRGTRLTVEYILNLLENGASWDEITNEYPDVTTEDIRASLMFAKSHLPTDLPAQTKQESESLWVNLTPTQRSQELRTWVASLPSYGVSVPDSAFDRGSIYE